MMAETHGSKPRQQQERERENGGGGCVCGGRETLTD